MIRVRFAPSPTGYLHIGGVRTALFNYLFAKNKKGKFLLRIEDTDKQRSSPEFLNDILNSLKWLGLNWDEGPEQGGDFGPYFQSQRMETYQKFAKKLIDEGNAYYCFCSQDRLKRLKQTQLENKKAIKYDGKCRNLPASELKKLFNERKSYTIRLKVKVQEIIFDDIIRGEIKFNTDNLDDFILIKSDGSPTYNFACAVDDMTMKISHVIRGDDHISNTPKQVLIYKSFGYNPPEFAHIPLIHSWSGEKISKRDGAVSLIEYNKMGFLPETLLNYLALLGWSYDGKQEFFSRDELVEKFSLKGISKNPARFDMEKLRWFNQRYIEKLDINRKFELFTLELLKNKLISENEVKKNKIFLIEILKLTEKNRIQTLRDFITYTDFFFLNKPKYDFKPKDWKKHAKVEILTNLTNLIMALKNIKEFKSEIIEKVFREFSDKYKVKFINLVQVVRIIVTGKTISPGLFGSIEILGKEKTLKRLEQFPEGLKNLPLKH